MLNFETKAYKGVCNEWVNAYINIQYVLYSKIKFNSNKIIGNNPTQHINFSINATVAQLMLVSCWDRQRGGFYVRVCAFFGRQPVCGWSGSGLQGPVLLFAVTTRPNITTDRRQRGRRCEEGRFPWDGDSISLLLSWQVSVLFIFKRACISCVVW